MLVVLTGGTGGAKLIQGLSHETNSAELTIICNTADDFVFYGLNISPDIDTIMYTLAGLSDEAKGWGIRDDTFTALGQFERYGCATWFKLGDKDLATHITRTNLLREGFTLSRVTDKICRSLGVNATLLPMSDDRIETRLETPAGEISFQEYFVKERWQPHVERVFYGGSENSRPGPGVLEAIRSASQIIICPSNPVTSIGPILAVPGVHTAIKETSARVVGISPIIGNSAISGPAHKLMMAMGMEASAIGVAKSYADLLDQFVIDTHDAKARDKIEGFGLRCAATAIRMDTLNDKRRLAREVLALAEK